MVVFLSTYKLTLQRATRHLKEFKDEFISVEHLLLNFIGGSDDAARLLKDHGLTEANMKDASILSREIAPGKLVRIDQEGEDLACHVT